MPASMLAFSLVSILFTYLLLRIQQWLPLNPQGLANVGTDLSFNTAVSFGTNTNWQSYTPETTMSYLSQMIGAGDPQLLVGGGGNLRWPSPSRAGSRATRRRRWAASGWISRAPRSTSCCRSRVVGALLLVLAGCHSELPSVYQGDHAGGRRADHSAGPAGLAGSHQDDRHQRRRLHQRQLGAPFREPHARSRISSRCC